MINKMQKIHKFNSIEFIEKIVSFYPRQYTGEMKTADFLENFLRDRGIPFMVQKFKTTVPIEKQASLKADGKIIKCQSVSLVSGKITNKDNLLSCFGEVNEYTNLPTITFNPYSKEISRGVFFHNAPAISISRDDVNYVLKAKIINGLIEIKSQSYTARNIFVGNYKNPKFICFAHYDSISTGAWDNASGVAAVMGNILLYPRELKKTLFIFVANEELSYDKTPGYWCKGFRSFEKTYSHLLKGAQKIIVVDGVGISTSYWMEEFEHLQSTILFNNLVKFKSKIIRLGAKTEQVAKEIYHNKSDVASIIKNKYILQTIKELHKKILNEFK